MTTKYQDFLFRRAVLALIYGTSSESYDDISKRLPDGYEYQDPGVNALLRFPAGVWESYIVEGKDYNPTGGRSLAEQRELIVTDLAKKGYQPEEVQELINGMEIKEDEPMRLPDEFSQMWLRHHPEFESEALKKIADIEREIKSERQSEPGGQFKKR